MANKQQSGGFSSTVKTVDGHADISYPDFPLRRTSLQCHPLWWMTTLACKWNKLGIEQVIA